MKDKRFSPKDTPFIQSTMTPQIMPFSGRKLTRAGFAALPPIIERAGEKASRRFLEFFLANIRNKNTRAAYARAARDFLAWCEERGLDQLERIDAFGVSSENGKNRTPSGAVLKLVVFRFSLASPID